MDEQSINNLIADLKNITISCIKDADSGDFTSMTLHIEERGNIIDKLRQNDKSIKNIGEILKTNDIYSLNEKLITLVTKKKQDVHEKLRNLAVNNKAAREYQTSQLMTNVFFNTKR